VTRYWQAAPCSVAAPGETDVACVAGTATVSAAGSATKFLVKWDGKHARRPARPASMDEIPIGVPVTSTTEEQR